MYDLQAQGIPLIFPIDQEQVVDALMHETKLKESLYAAMGHDIKDLQKKIAGEISRGIAGGQMYSEIARNIASWARIPKNNAMRITRTEAHRIQCKAASDAQQKAKSRGADVVKQWDSTLDGRTRDSHRKIDGEIRETDEKFSNGLEYPGDPSGAAGEVINCRCALLTRARWALGRDETKYLGNMDGMSDEDLKPLADKLHMSVDELRTYQGQIVPINAKSYDDFKRQYNKIWRYEGSDLQKQAEARIAGYKSERVRLGAQKMNSTKNTGKSEKSIEKNGNTGYNNSSTYNAYKKLVDKGDITPLASFELFERFSNEIDTRIVGTTTANGIEVKDKSYHFIARVIGSVEQKRNGVPIDSIISILQNPDKIGEVVERKNGFSQRFIKNGIGTVSINPKTGKLIQVNPLKAVKKE
jgi:SPP1 gp7 family putative phage head morphogenesis protein